MLIVRERGGDGFSNVGVDCTVEGRDLLVMIYSIFSILQLQKIREFIYFFKINKNWISVETAKTKLR